MIRTREERQADRAWCERYMESDTFEDCGHGVVLAVTIGTAVWLAVAAWAGWLS